MSTELRDAAIVLAESLVGVLPKLLLVYWGLASAAVLVTLLPLPIPRAFK